jgi:methanogenic corrinoid protein MtbC1
VPSSHAPGVLAHRLVAAAQRFDSRGVEQALSHALAAHPFEVVCLSVVRPALMELGERWRSGEITPAVEHFATGLIRRRLEHVDAVLDAGAGRPLVVVGAGPGEMHDVGALIFSILLRRHGLHVVYLGANLPQEALVDVARRLEPELLCLSATLRETAAALPGVAAELSALSPAPRLVFGGRAFDEDPQLVATVASVAGIYLGPDAQQAALEAERLAREPAG